MSQNKYAFHDFAAIVHAGKITTPAGYKIVTEGEILPGDRIVATVNDAPRWLMDQRNEGRPAKDFAIVIRRERSLMDACLAALDDLRQVRRDLDDVSPAMAEKAENADAAFSDLLADWSRYCNVNPPEAK